MFQVPGTHEEWNTIERGFSSRWNFPGVYGAIDGKHILIRAPPDCGSDFQSSSIFNDLEKNMLPKGGFLVGDAAFPLKTYLLKPYQHSPLTYEQKIFNYRLSRARRIVIPDTFATKVLFRGNQQWFIDCYGQINHVQKNKNNNNILYLT